MTLSEQIYDVLIVGAGPVGLATALGLYERGIDNILVIDQAHSFRPAGQTVDLLSNGLKALKCISHQAYANIKSAGSTFSQSPTKQVWNRKNLSGKITFSTPLNFDYWLNKYGEGRVSIPWYQIQTNLRNLLPPQIIKINHRCVNLQVENDLVWVNCLSKQPIQKNPFAYWEKSTTTEQDQANLEGDDYQQIQHNFKAKLVIAADGINSTIRKILYDYKNLPQWAMPQYSGYGAIGCLSIENVPDEIGSILETNYLQGDRVTTIIPDSKYNKVQTSDRPRIILIPKGENSFGYLLHAPLPLNLLLNSSSPEMIALAAKILTSANYPLAFVQLITLSDPEKLITRPYYLHPANLPVEDDYLWSYRRVVLVGDAAHGMPPFIAQGTNQGFEDALMIVSLIIKLINHNHLDDEGVISNLYQKYEKDRRPFMSYIQSVTMENHRWQKSQWDEYANQVYCRNFSI